jgi:hypothetical protein
MKPVPEIRRTKKAEKPARENTAGQIILFMQPSFDLAGSDSSRFGFQPFFAYLNSFVLGRHLLPSSSELHFEIGFLPAKPLLRPDHPKNLTIFRSDMQEISQWDRFLEFQDPPPSPEFTARFQPHSQPILNTNRNQELRIALLFLDMRGFVQVVSILGSYFNLAAIFRPKPVGKYERGLR